LRVSGLKIANIIKVKGTALRKSGRNLFLNWIILSVKIMEANKAILAIIIIVAGYNSFGQESNKYSELSEEAAILREKEEYVKSGEKYTEAFAVAEDGGMFLDRYYAAGSWVLAKEIDSAFVHLFIFAKEFFSSTTIQSFPIFDLYALYDHFLADPVLKPLHTDQRWVEVLEIIEETKTETEGRLDMPLVILLDSMFQEDQKYRLQMGSIQEEYGMDSDEMRSNLRTMEVIDSLNLLTVEKIVNERGWLGPDVLGFRGNLTMFLVIQHSDLETQEKYLPIIQDAVKSGDARPDHLALLVDRVAIKQGRKQVYGSQFGADPETDETFVSPLEDPDNVDKRRAEVGLNTLQEYISQWGLTWDAEVYKKQLPDIEAKQKEMMKGRKL
jgi:hypothetical protein